MAEETKMSKNVAKLVEDVKSLTVLELSELVTALQDELGVTAAPMAAAPAAAGAAAAEEEAGDDSGTKTVMLTGAGGNKIAVIKALRAINPSLGLKEAKDMTEATPAEVLKDAKAEEAKEAADKLKEAGAEVELK